MRYRSSGAYGCGGFWPLAYTSGWKLLRRVAAGENYVRMV